MAQRHRGIALLVSFSIALAACGAGSSPVAGGPVPLPGALRCSPTTLGPADTLTLAMSVPHGRELSIQNPVGDFFNLVIAEPQPADGPMLFPADTFRITPQVRLPVASLRAKPFVFGRDSAERVFSRPGTYRLSMAEVLNTDDGTPVTTCMVQLRSAP